MNTDIINLLVKFLAWLPIVFLWLVYIASGVSYFWSKAPKIFSFKILIITTVVFKLLYAALLSVVQYYVWSQSEFTQFFINSPLSSEVPLSDFLRSKLGFIFGGKLGYFLFYSWGHFWISALLSMAVALCFYVFLRALRRHNDRFFYEGETELGFLLSLIVGWPNIVLFVPIAFIAVVLVSIFRLLFYKEPYTTLGAPMLLGVLITMIFGTALIEILNLSVLKI